MDIETVLIGLAATLESKMPIVLLDLESTGSSPKTDRIVQLAVAKWYPDGRVKTYSTLVNPEIPIPAGATKVHGITDEMVKDAPTFKVLAPTVIPGFKNALIVGYNVKGFDLVMLEAECARAGIEMKANDYLSIDPFRIWGEMERRDLGSAMKRFCNEDHAGAHDAEADLRAAGMVMIGMMGEFGDRLPKDLAGLDKIGRKEKQPHFFDDDGKIQWLDGGWRITFGKAKGTLITEVEASYVAWMKTSNFTAEVIACLEAAGNGVVPPAPEPE